MPTQPEAAVTVSADDAWLKEVAEEDLTLQKRAGEGTYCTCHLGVYRGENVAVKQLKPCAASRRSAWRDLKLEADVLSQLSHPGVIGFRGAGMSDGRPFLMLERLTTTLAESLVEDSTAVRPQRDLAKRWPLARALGCAVELAAALCHMHEDAFPEQALLHRDLKPDNVGFAADGRCVLFDFGLSKLVPRASKSRGSQDATPHKMTGETGSERYMAPEVAQCEPYDAKADVYSFGMLLFYMCSRTKPFEGVFGSKAALRAAVAEGRRPALPARGWPSSLCSLVEACWHADAADRPSFAEVLARLAAIAAEVGSGGGSPLSATSSPRPAAASPSHSPLISSLASLANRTPSLAGRRKPSLTGSLSSAVLPPLLRRRRSSASSTDSLPDAGRCQQLDRLEALTRPVAA